MNEPDTFPTDPVSERNARRSRRIVLLTILVLVLIVGAAIFASKSGLDRELVRQQLDAIAAQIKTRGAAQGRDVTFTYGDVAIKGGFTHKHAVIANPALAIKPLASSEPPPADEKPHTLLLATDSMEIYPEGSNLSAMRIELPQPVRFSTIEQPKKVLLTVTASSPLTMHYAVDRHATQWKFAMPAETRLTYLREQQAQGEEDKTPTIVPIYDTLVVAMDSGTGELALQKDGSGLGQGMLELKSIRIAPESAPKEGLITVDQVVTHWSNQRDSNNLNIIHSNFTIDQIKADPALLPYAPVSAAADVTYEGAMPAEGQPLAAMGAGKTALKLKTFHISTKDATFDATADFTANPEDKLPVGAANVTVTNLPFIVGELKKYQLMSDDREKLIAALLQQITGTPYADLKDVRINVARARGGSFMIGKSTFEELFATLLQNALSKKPVPVPTIPPPDQKKAQPPITLPEQTRG